MVILLKSSKGQAIEMFEILILVVILTVLFLFLNFNLLQRESAEKEMLARKEIEMKVENAIISFKSSKVYGTERSLATILSDAVANGNLTVNYGEGYGSINITKLVTEFFDSYFDRRWVFVLHTPIKEKEVALVLDTSDSLKDETNIIKSKINEIYREGLKKKIRLKIFLLDGIGRSFDCGQFSGTEVEKECSLLKDCSLVGATPLEQTEEDWGNAIKCVIEKYNTSAVIVLTDELSTGSEPAVCTNGANMGNFTISFNSGLQSCKDKNVSVFALKGSISVSDCLNYWTTWCDSYFSSRLTPQSCQMYAIDLLGNRLKFVADECKGKYFDLATVNPADAVAEIMKIIPPPPDVVFGYEVPKDVKNVQTFVLDIPYVSYEGEKIRGELKVW
jgi:hypothetical protein